MTKRKRRSPSSSPDNPLQREWLDRMARSQPVIDTWRERAKQPQFSEPGSSLKADDLPGLLSVETTAWYSMCIASEHLDFTLDALRSTATMYPTAYMPAVRTAFMCAVNALYLLAGESRFTRRQRVLHMRADELRIQINGLRDMKLPDGKPDAARDGLIGQLRERQETLQLAADEIGSTEKVTQMRSHQTKAVNWVAEYMHGISDDPFIHGGFQTIWRDGSSAAHGQLQYAIMRIHENETVAHHGDSSVVHMRGNLERDVGPAFVGTVLILQECFRLYDLRRVKL